MGTDDEHWLSIVDAFNAAAVDSGSWLDALSALSSATGSRVGELIGLGSSKTVPFNWVTDLGPDWAEEFVAIGGGDPTVNPFVREGTRIPVLKVLASGDFITREERRTNPFLADHARRHDIAHICLTPLIKESGMLVGLAVIRSARQGEISVKQRAIFTSIAPHVRTAVRTQMALEHKGALLVAGALKALSLAVFICDRKGAVRALTPAAESLVSAGNTLRLRHGVLRSAKVEDARTLSTAINNAAGGLDRPGVPVASTVLLRDESAQPLLLEVVPLPRGEYNLGFEARVLVIVRRSQPEAQLVSTLLQTAYRLTAAEIDIALRLVKGHSPEEIAAVRAATIGTVRVQIRSIYSKLGVHRLSELSARINQLS